MCADDGLTVTSMPGTSLYVGGQISLSQRRKKISILLGGPFHSGAPRLCLPCLPSRDATAVMQPVMPCRHLHPRCLSLHSPNHTGMS